MPIYEYACQACGKEFEALVRRQDTPACPACQSTELERRLSLPAIKSEATHDLAMRAAKRRDKIQGRERVNEQRIYELNHDSEGH